MTNTRTLTSTGCFGWRSWLQDEPYPRMRREEGMMPDDQDDRLPTQDATGLAGSNAPFSLFSYFLLPFVVFAFLLGSLSIGAKNLPVCE